MDQEFWHSRSALVTGATGHIGGWLVKKLVELKASVVCLDRDWLSYSELIRTGLVHQVKVVRGDLGDLELIRQALGEHEVKTVFHLAAQSIVGVATHDPIATFESNIRGTWCLLEACRQVTGVKQVVIASSDKVYGESDQLPYREEMPMQAIYPHDVSKACAEMLATCYAKTYGLRLGIARLPNIYGGGDLNWSRIIPGTIRSITQNEPPVINSNGRFIRDYLYVEDAVSAHLFLAEKLAMNHHLDGQAFNISSEVHLTVLELVEHILRLCGSELRPVVRDQVNNEIMNQYMSAQKAREMLGWQAKFSLDEGLRRTIDWYMSYLKQ